MTKSTDIWRRAWQGARDVALPAGVYFVVFVLYTWPAVGHFGNRYFCDAGDGLKYVWDLWWVDHAISAAESPWWTGMFYFPYGTTLIADNLTPLNGVMASLLMRCGLTLVEAHNAIFVGTFVGSGVAMYWLALAFVKDRTAAIVGGLIFAFCGYRFAHAEGHLNMLSCYLLPLLVLSGYRMLETARKGWGVAAGALLVLIGFTDWYLLVYGCLILGTMVIWQVVIKTRAEGWGAGRLWVRRLFPAANCMGVVIAIFVGPLVFGIERAQIKEDLKLPGSAQVGHSPGEFGMDLFAPFIPGGHWRWNALTEFFWGRLKGNMHEGSVYMGLSTLLLMIVAWRRWYGGSDRLKRPADMSLWFVLFWVFFIFSLGPRLIVFGHGIASVLPYQLLVWCMPPLRMGGVPVRMFIVAMIGAAIAGAYGWQALAERRRFGILVLIGVWMLVDFWPRAIAETSAVPPAWATLIRTTDASIPATAGVIDIASPLPGALLAQTVHGHPIQVGYVSRESATVRRAKVEIDDLLAAHNWAELHKRGYGFLVSRENEEGGDLEKIGVAKGVNVYRLR